MSLLAVLAPWLYAPAEPRRRLPPPELGRDRSDQEPAEVAGQLGARARQETAAHSIPRREAAAPSRAEATLWENLVDTYRRFETDEVPGARVVASYRAEPWPARGTRVAGPSTAVPPGWW